MTVNTLITQSQQHIHDATTLINGDGNIHNHPSLIPVNSYGGGCILEFKRRAGFGCNQQFG